mmetsp:Transcript_20717/g.18875  ORF Transcript_20717/g.18875 Transcript_20717/m.18875 type:complete len:139 (-) Transcript_20717:75-491(-)
MRPALRQNPYDINTELYNYLIYSQLLECLHQIHNANILHCDIRPSNCLRFDDGWQIIDFDLAVPIPDSDIALGNNDSGTCTVYVGTQQHLCAGYKVQKFIEMSRKSKYELVNVNWTKTDDLEMLYVACLQLYNKFKRS